jgi:hypothetical protein
MSMRKLMTMRAFLESPDHLGSEGMLGGESWRSWRIVLIAAMGEALTVDERKTFTELTGRAREPGRPVEELWGVVGRRGGKSRAIAALSVYIASCIDYRPVLAAGQIGVVPVLSGTKEQATEILNYATGMFAAAPGLAGLLASDPTAETITLRTRIELQIRAASFRRSRGFTAVGAVGDECSFWRSEQTTNPDVEILNALRPSLATTGGPLICISSAYAKRGEMYRAYREHYGPDGDPLVLVVKASSKAMNPSLSDRFLARAYEKDPVSAASEYGSEFRNDIDAFITDDLVDAAIMSGVHEIAPQEGVRYSGFCDGASGSGGGDSMTMGIAFKDGEHFVLACLHERRPPFDPEAVTEDFAKTLKAYGIKKVVGDKWAAGFVEAAFRRNDIAYEASAAPKSDIYKEVLPLLASGRVKLLDNARMRVQLLALERRTARGGKDSIDHPPRGHDDLINAAAGALVNAATGKAPFLPLFTAEIAARAAMPISQSGFDRSGYAGWGGKLPLTYEQQVARNRIR